MHNKATLRLHSSFAGALAIILCATLFAGNSFAQDSEPGEDEAMREYSERGADTCLRCHDEDSEYPVLPIFKTKHARIADERTPFAQLQCETCHGPVGEHGKRKLKKGEERQPMLYFGINAAAAREEQNGICLDCHRNQSRIAWHGSAHELADVDCASCHKVHAAQDQVLTTTGQPEVCYPCHTKARADFYKPSVHPVRFGQLACSDCHSPHASMTDALMAAPTLNQTCYTCHAEKRGPFLWEHAPVAEDCALCHTAHGSVHPALLTRRPPLLCQQCHSQLGHPSVARSPAGLADGMPSGFLLAGSCLNCHSQVHGSNHPSGVKLMR
ncbi:MAG: DmsE family decaheme c-type cytochrome [Gammaproteobacteria bacterium]|nr:DmsE family decaheme c-type cytochrome [Gammaproteobacteria bacterium]